MNNDHFLKYCFFLKWLENYIIHKKFHLYKCSTNNLGYVLTNSGRYLVWISSRIINKDNCLLFRLLFIVSHTPHEPGAWGLRNYSVCRFNVNLRQWIQKLSLFTGI
jgi:hypothetical protein